MEVVRVVAVAWSYVDGYPKLLTSGTTCDAPEDPVRGGTKAGASGYGSNAYPTCVRGKLLHLRSGGLPTLLKVLELRKG